MSKFKKLLAVAPVMAFVGILTAPATRADTFSLTVDHCSGGCGPAGTTFGTVTLTQAGTTVDVDVHLNDVQFNTSYEFAKTGAGDDQAFKFNATGVTLADISVTQDVSGQTLAPETGSFNGDGTGSFSFGIECTTCKSGLSSAFSNDVEFQITNATIADLTQPNANGFVFTADVGNPITGSTGPIAANPIDPTPVPEPASIWLLGSALVGMGFMRKRAAFARVPRDSRH